MPVIVVPVFNRPRAIKRLLDSLERADYPGNTRLIISVEGGAPDSVLDIVRNFSPSLLEVEINQQPERLGLKGHILACGDLAEKHGSIVLLEDDLVVDRYFYQYAHAALAYYDESPEIAGIALYGYEYNEYARYPFRSTYNGYSTYLMQVPCSWGQCWTARQWRSFREWLSVQDGLSAVGSAAMPEMIKQWPESSWKKHFAAFLVERGQYVVYPYQAYSTNCSDPGEHIRYASNVYQVAMASQRRKSPRFDFCPPDNLDVVYDAFMEPVGNMVFEYIGMGKDEVEVDLYGVKPLETLKRKPYVLTCRKVRMPVKGYSLKFRPIENNLLYPLDDPREGIISLAANDDVLGQHHKGCLEYTYLSGFNVCSPRVIKGIAVKMFKDIASLTFRFMLYLWSLPRSFFRR